MASPYKGLQIASATAESRNERFWSGFSQNVFSMGMMEHQKNVGPIFLGFTPQNRLFCPTPWEQLATLRKLRLYRGWTPIPAKLWPVHYICSTETTININDRLICQFLGTTPISAKWNSATPIPAKWPYPPKKTHLCENLCGDFWWNFFRSPRTLGQRSFWKKRQPIWSTFAPVAPFTICNPIYGLTTLYYISQPRSQMKYSAAMY